MKKDVNKAIAFIIISIFSTLTYILYNQFKRIDTSFFSSLQQPKSVRLVFAGDLMQHKPQVNAALTNEGYYDYTKSFLDVKKIFEEADIAILNFETTLTPKNHYTGYPLFRSPAELADAIKNIGIDIALMANNHICDNGRLGIEFTASRFDSLGIAYTGAFIDSSAYKQLNPLYFTAKGLNFALLNYTYDTNGMPIPKGMLVNIIDTTTILRDLQQIDRTKTDCVIVFFHWGDEYARNPNKEQRMLADFCHRHNVEIVIGSHPHVVQPFETHFDADGIIHSLTAYSLGNLVSNQRERYRNGGLIVTLDIQKMKNKPVRITPFYTPVWVRLPDYRIIPPVTGDTLSLSESEYILYNQFMEDTRKLLKYDEIFKES